MWIDDRGVPPRATRAGPASQPASQSKSRPARPATRYAKRAGASCHIRSRVDLEYISFPRALSDLGYTHLLDRTYVVKCVFFCPDRPGNAYLHIYIHILVVHTDPSLSLAGLSLLLSFSRFSLFLPGASCKARAAYIASLYSARRIRPRSAPATLHIYIYRYIYEGQKCPPKLCMYIKRACLELEGL